MADHCIIVYRGPLERSRLSFIIESLQLVYTSLEFVWISPLHNETRAAYFNEFIKKYDFVRIKLITDKATSYVTTLLELRKIFKNIPQADVAWVGFSSAYFAPSAPRSQRWYWFINGIPEEKMIHNKSLLSVARVKGQWILAKILIRPTLIITVSNRMSRFVKKYFNSNVFSAPTCVDTTTFRNNVDKPQRMLFTYLGSGAGWQALDLLSEVWKAIHKINPEVYFRVISRDERCRILADGIDPAKIEFVAAKRFEEVANYLSESRVGFLVRYPHIVNEVSFPTKLGEYIASGLWVVSSDLDWDVSDVIKKFDVGCLLKPGISPQEAAQRILDGYETASKDQLLKQRLTDCTKELDRQTWKKKLSLTMEPNLIVKWGESKTV